MEGNKIDEFRERQGKSYHQLSRDSGVATTYIYLLAKGKRTNPSLEVMQKIASALGQKVERVFQLNK